MIFAVAALLMLLPIPLLLLNLGGWLWQPGAPAYGAALAMLLGSGVVALLGSFWFPLSIAIRNARAGEGITTPDD